MHLTRRLIVGSITLAALNYGSAGATEVPFDPQPAISTNADSAQSVFAADVDGDGDIDALSASESDDKIAWYESDGASPPTFTERIITEDPDGPGGAEGFADGADSVFAVDVDGDGDIDVLSASNNDGRYAWYENDGGTPPGWTARTIGTEDGALAVFAADVDGDGDVDALGASTKVADGRVEWYENDGASPPGWTDHTIATSILGESVFAADIDGDGDIDVLAGSNDDGITWYANNGASPPGWTARTIAGAAEARSVFAADMDGDGDIDALSARYGDDEIAWYENDGASPPGWTARTITNEDIGARSVFAADVDGDGDLDALSVAEYDNTIAWYENDGGSPPGWTTRTITTVASSPASVFAADVDGDGDLDALSASEGDDTIAWYENETIHRSASFPVEGVLSSVASYYPVSVFAADIDGDGDLDVLTGSQLDTEIAWYDNTAGDGSAWTHHTASSTAGWPRGLFAADLDGDGDTDLLAADQYNDTILWCENDGSPAVGLWPQYTVSTLVTGPVSVFAGDVDNDGDLDAFSASIDDNKVAWYLNDGTPKVGTWPQYVISTLSTGPQWVHAADVNGDGWLDALSASSADNRIAWYVNDGTPAVGAWARTTISTLASGAKSVYAADIDGDGDIDALSASSSDSEIAWYANTDGAGSFGAQQIISLGATLARAVLAADMDGDGDQDVVYVSQGDDRIAWYENDGTPGGYGDWTFHDVSTSANNRFAAFAGDVDGDGDTDLLAVSASDNKVAWYENRGGQFALFTSSTSPPSLDEGDQDDFLRVIAIHNGRSGDTDIELATLELLFEQGLSDPLTTAEANALIANLHVYLDDGSYSFDGADTLVDTVETLSLDSGVQTVVLPDGDPDLQITRGTPRIYFVVAELTVDAASRSPNVFRVTHRTETSSTAEDRDNDIPLSLQYVSNVSSGIATATDAYADVTGVLPPDNAVGVSVGTNVYVLFSAAVDPAFLDLSTLRLLDGGGSPLAADLSLSSSGLQATLDPNATLAFDTIHTVEVSSGLQDMGGNPFAPFKSRFRTETSFAETPLPTVSVEAVPPSSPTVLSNGGTPPHSGWSIAGAGDLNGDGIDDVIAGAPGTQVEITTPPATHVEAGVASVYLGTDTPTDLDDPDIVFAGESAHARVGVAVAGGFDFNCDGTPDLLIGAEEYNRTGTGDLSCAADPVCGNGKVYLIYFDPEDYPNLGDPGTPDRIDLARVANGEVDEIQGLVLGGVSLGDRAGFALAGGGRVQSGSLDCSGTGRGPNLLIGAPGAGSGAGAVYLLLNNDSPVSTPTGRVDLNGVGSTLPGVVYTGATAGDGLGHAVAFPGDVTGTPSEDYALGAPDADSGGIAYVLRGGTVVNSGTSVDVSTVPGSVHVLGDQSGEQLGFALAGGGDNRRDETDDLLIGAPGADAGAGRVIHTSDRLTAPSVLASTVGTTVDGVIWEGAGAGDSLGFSVAGAGDVTGNNWDDILLGAPHADPVSDPTGLADAGVVYLIEGETDSDPAGGGQSVGDVEGSIAGLRLAGVEAAEHAGHAVTAAGDLDNDGVRDFVVGGPDRTVGATTGAGQVYFVVNSRPVATTECEPSSVCLVRDLENGAQLYVPAGSLTQRATLAVGGVLDPTTLAERGMNVPAHKILVGAADYHRVDQGDDPLQSPDSTAHIAMRAELEDQLETGETIWFYDDELGEWDVLEGRTGDPDTNPHYAAHKAVRVDVNALDSYAVFFDDVDGDLYRDDRDCDTDNIDAWAAPGEVLSLELTLIGGVTELSWTAPASPGGTPATLRYDTIRSEDPDDFSVTTADCVESDGTDTETDDTDPGPPAGSVYYYLIRAENGCPEGGALGEGRSARDCDP